MENTPRHTCHPGKAQAPDDAALLAHLLFERSLGASLSEVTELPNRLKSPALRIFHPTYGKARLLQLFLANQRSSWI
jgi:hypothetical protein